jgi:hypothetical protein
VPGYLGTTAMPSWRSDRTPSTSPGRIVIVAGGVVVLGFALRVRSKSRGR